MGLVQKDLNLYEEDEVEKEKEEMEKDDIFGRNKDNKNINVYLYDFRLFTHLVSLLVNH